MLECLFTQTGLRGINNFLNRIILVETRDTSYSRDNHHQKYDKYYCLLLILSGLFLRYKPQKPLSVTGIKRGFAASKFLQYGLQLSKFIDPPVLNCYRFDICYRRQLPQQCARRYPLCLFAD